MFLKTRVEHGIAELSLRIGFATLALKGRRFRHAVQVPNQTRCSDWDKLKPNSDRTTLLLLASAALIALLMLRVFDPATSGVFPPCPFRALTGWLCPGCGSLRAIHQLLLGNFRKAFALNPFAVISLPFLAYGTASYTRFVLRGKYLPRIFVPGAWINALAASIVSFGIIRNF